jgi:predicted nucleotidyltransferase
MPPSRLGGDGKHLPPACGNANGCVSSITAMAQVNLFQDFREFLGSLNSARVRYLLLGGYAVIHYGYRRATDDLDVWISMDPDNAKRISKVLQEFGGFSANQVKPSLFLQGDKVIMFGREPVRIDILTSPSGVDFEACYKRRRVAVWNGIKVPLISLKDLRVNKAASGRLKDLADLEQLNVPVDRKQKKEIAIRRRKRKGRAAGDTAAKRKGKE